jgi:hypothetical protein
MAKQPDNLVLQILKNIQATLTEHSKRFDRIDQRVEGIDYRLDEIREGMIASLGLASHAHVRDDSIQKEIDTPKRRIKRLEAKV